MGGRLLGVACGTEKVIICSCCELPCSDVGYVEDAPFVGDKIITCVVCLRLQKLGIVDRNGRLLVEASHFDED